MPEPVLRVSLRLVARVLDEAGEVLEEVEVDSVKAAPMQEINIQLDRLGYSSMFHSGHQGWAVTQRDAQRI